MIIEQGAAAARHRRDATGPSAPLLIHEDAIYIHHGQQYQVEHLDWEDKKAYVRRSTSTTTRTRSSRST